MCSQYMHSHMHSHTHTHTHREQLVSDLRNAVYSMSPGPHARSHNQGPDVRCDEAHRMNTTRALFKVTQGEGDRVCLCVCVCAQICVWMCMCAWKYAISCVPFTHPTNKTHTSPVFTHKLTLHTHTHTQPPPASPTSYPPPKSSK